MKKTAQEIAVTKRDLLKEQEDFYFSDNRPLSLTKLRCKDYYNLFQEGKTTEPTAVKRWSSFFPYFATSWEQPFNTIYKSTKDNKLREFGYKILLRVLVTNKQLKKFKISNDDLCDQCKTPDSLENTFLQCPANVKCYYEILSWFNVSHNTLVNLSPEQILMQKYIPGPINDNLRRPLELLILFIKKYVCSCKIKVVPLNCKQKKQCRWRGTVNRLTGSSEKASSYSLECDGKVLNEMELAVTLNQFYVSVNEDIPPLDATTSPAFLPAETCVPTIQPHEVCRKLLAVQPFKARDLTMCHVVS